MAHPPNTVLAVDGGPPIRIEPFPPRIQIDERELAAVTALFEDAMRCGGSFDRYEGPHVDAYEQELADYFGVRFVTCVSSGTAAVHTALGALHLEPGSEVICSSFTDPGAVMPILWNNCVPVWAEHDLDTFLMTPAGIEAVITPYTKAIVVGQIQGFVADMNAIMAIAAEHDLTVIGDCSQAHGSTYYDSRSAPLGHIGAMSLMSGKHMVAGGQGGMVATDDESLYWAAKRFADRGKPFGLTNTSNASLGLNYRMHELEAVVGRIQLDKLDSIRSRRRDVLRRIEEGVRGLEAVRGVQRLPGVEINPWAALFLLDLTRLTTDNATFAAAMAAEGIPTEHSYRMAIVYQLDFMRNLKTYGSSSFPYGFDLAGRRVTWTPPDNPVVEEIATSLLLLPLHECWTAREADDVVSAFTKVEAAFLKSD